METIIGSAIAGVVAIIVCVINGNAQKKQILEQHNETIALVEYRLKELEKKQDKHNQLIERMIKVEQSDKAQWYDINEIKAKLP